MGNFNGSRNDRRGGFGRGRSFGAGRSFAGRSGFGRDDRGERQMFSAVCSNCGKDCQVPFKPTGNKPVYCSDCFEKMGGRDERKSFNRPGLEAGNGGNSDLKTQLEALNHKLDKIVSLLQPQPNKEESSLSGVTTDNAPVEKTEAKSTKSKKSSKEKTPEETK